MVSFIRRRASSRVGEAAAEAPRHGSGSGRSGGGNLVRGWGRGRRRRQRGCGYGCGCRVRHMCSQRRVTCSARRVLSTRLEMRGVHLRARRPSATRFPHVQPLRNRTQPCDSAHHGATARPLPLGALRGSTRAIQAAHCPTTKRRARSSSNWRALAVQAQAPRQA